MKKETLHQLLKIDLFLLTIILIVAFCLRLYNIDKPLADFHSWRQADTAAVARNFARDGFDLMHPKYDDLSNIQSGKDNPEGHRFVEFPLYNALTAGAFVAFPYISIETWGRLISIISSLIVIGLLYYFLLKEYSRTAAITGAVIFAIFPFFVFFSRVVLPEMNSLAFSMLSIFFLYKFVQDKITRLTAMYFIFSILCFASALLIKPTTIFFAIPLLYLFFSKYGFKVYAHIPFYLFFALSALPLFLWREYIQAFPEGVPGSGWLITSVNTPEGLKNIFFRPAFFRWIFFERINSLILGGYATFLFILGLIVKPKKYFLHSFIVAAFAYLFVFQGGNVQHAYYQVLILPALAMAAGLGTAFLLENRSLFISKIGVFILIIFVLGFSWLISYYQVKGYYGYPQDLVEMGRVINQVTTRNDKVITDTVGDTTLLYLADRKGAPAVFNSLQELKEKGYTYFITMSKDVAESVEMETDFQVIRETEKFTLFKL